MRNVGVLLCACAAGVGIVALEREHPHAARGERSTFLHLEETADRTAEAQPLDLDAEAARLRSEDPVERWTALRRLVSAGPYAIPSLLDVLAVDRFDEHWIGESWVTGWNVDYAIAHIGAPAIDPLVQAIADGQRAPLAISLLGVLGERHDDAIAPLIALLGGEHAEYAARAIRCIGPRAADAIPDLEQMGGDERLTSVASSALMAIGKEGMPAIARLLARNFRGYNLGGLERLGLDAAPAVPIMLEVLEQGEPHQKRDVCWTLADMGPVGAPALPVLREYASTEKRLEWNTTVSGSFIATEALVGIGVPDDQAEQLILRLVDRGERPNWRLHQRVAALGAVRGPRVAARIIAAFGLWNAAEMGASAVPPLRTLMASQSARERYTALRALEQIGEPARAVAADALRLAAQDPAPDVRVAAFDVLDRLDVNIESEVLEPLLAHAVEDLRIAAARAYLRASGNRRRVVAALAPIARTPGAAAVLRACGETSRAALPEPTVAERPESGKEHWGIERLVPESCRWMASLGGLSPEYLEVARKNLAAHDAADRVGAALVLVRHGVQSADVLQALIEGSRPENYRGFSSHRRLHRSEDVRVTSIEVLASLGERARPALPVLHGILRDYRSAAVRESARVALTKIER